MEEWFHVKSQEEINIGWFEVIEEKREGLDNRDNMIHGSQLCVIQLK
jgi:hypothetical protein